MKTKKENYVAPKCNTVDVELQQIICTSGTNTNNATHEGFEEDEYEW